MRTSVVCVDVEPGGATVPWAAIGVAELVEDEVRSSFMLRFHSPLYGAQRADEFIDVWRWLEPLFVDRRLIAFGVSSDRRSLRRLREAAGLGPAGLQISCAAAMARRVLAPTRSLWRSEPVSVGTAQDWAVKLWSPEEIERRRRLWRSGHRDGKVILHSARDDALICADIVRWAMHEKQQSLAELIVTMPAHEV